MYFVNIFEKYQPKLRTRFRLLAGLEDADDLIADLEQALG
jgi:cystathionine beta-lyase/cystathionine gamma-synthase